MKKVAGARGLCELRAWRAEISSSRVREGPLRSRLERSAGSNLEFLVGLTHWFWLRYMALHTSTCGEPDQLARKCGGKEKS
jgi:hypothetical protein